MENTVLAGADRDRASGLEKETGLVSGEVRLEVPASPEFLRVTRIMVAGVASRLGFTLDEVEDLRIAIDELCFTLVGKGRDGTLTLRYVMLPDGLEVIGTGHFEDGDASQDLQLSPMSEQILSAMVDECELESSADGPTFRMVKRRRPA
ncbi:MAG: serine/threonine-protein kinase RsbW [Actinomycetota bacterium]|jgi:serine/threonine-protein kinase RsbW|nr:serine/threonine-protein kinase RsbW [Actinomycetota bacterium]